MGEEKMDIPDPVSARASLDAAHDLGVRVRGDTRWFADFLLVVAGWVIVWTTASGITRESPNAVRGAILALGAATSLSLRWLFVRRREVHPRARRRIFIMMAAMLAIYLVLYLPLVWVPGTAGVATWIAIGTASSLPFVVGSWRERRNG